MQRATRSNVDNSLVKVEDPEQILRERCRSTADQGRQVARDARDSDGEEYSEAKEMNIPELYVPDLDNTPLETAIQNAMALNDRKTIYRIRCPKLKQYIGMNTLTVKLPDGWLEVPTDLPVDFVANCASTLFNQPRLLVEAMQHLITTQPELTILPGDDVPLVRGRYLSCYELLERLNHYINLCVMYGECFLRHEEAQLSRERDEILRTEMHEEILMSRISSNMDKILGQLIRDNKFRKANKKLMYPTPRINPRASPVGSVTEVCSMKDALKDECRGILQVAFLPEPEEGANREPTVVTPGEDIPDAMGRPREERRRSNLSVNTTPNTNNGSAQHAQQRPTDRSADRTVNLHDREQHRTNVISEVQQNLMNISNS